MLYLARMILLVQQLSSTKTKQVVQSTLAAEANTLSDALDAAYFMHQLYAETFLTRESKIYTFFDKKLTNLVFEKIG